MQLDAGILLEDLVPLNRTFYGLHVSTTGVLSVVSIKPTDTDTIFLPDVSHASPNGFQQVLWSSAENLTFSIVAGRLKLERS